MPEKFTTAQIREVLNRVWSGDFEPFEPENTDWEDGLYEMCDKSYIQEEGVLAALQALEESFLDEGQTISWVKFEKFMEDAYKQAHDSKAAWAKEFAYGAFDKDTLDRFEDYINWDEYAETFTDAYVFVEVPRKTYVFDADFEF